MNTFSLTRATPQVAAATRDAQVHSLQDKLAHETARAMQLRQVPFRLPAPSPPFLTASPPFF